MFFFIYLTGPLFLTFFFQLMHRVAAGGGKWFNGSWSAAQLPLSIVHKELYPVVHVWDSRWWDNCIQFCCDNQGVVVAVISFTTSKDTCVMQMLRELFVVRQYVPVKLQIFIGQ